MDRMACLHIFMNTPDGQRYFTTDRPVAVLMVLSVGGVRLLFLGQLPVTLMPDMSYPPDRAHRVSCAAREIENDISRGIEEQLGVISGLSEISISRAGISDVILEFTWGSSMSDAIQNTLEKLDTVRLPRGAEKPLLLHYDPSLDPVMELSLSFGHLGCFFERSGSLDPGIGVAAFGASPSFGSSAALNR